MPNPKCNPNTLLHLEEAILCAKTRHSEAEILAAAKALGIENMLPEPHTLSLFTKAANKNA